MRNGYKQEVRCTMSRTTRNSTTSEHSVYATFQSCPTPPGDFTGIIKFEVSRRFLFPCQSRDSEGMMVCHAGQSAITALARVACVSQLAMIVLFMLALSFVRRRKKYLLDLHQYRIANFA